MEKKFKIGFLMAYEHSSFNAAFGLARVLENRGHEVVFFIKAGNIFPQYVDKNGFESAIMDTKDIYQDLDNKKNVRFRPWTRLKEHAQRVRLEQKCLADFIEEKSLDLFFLDIFRSYPYALTLAKIQIPTLLLIPNFSSKLSSDYPPVFSSMFPNEGKRPNILYRVFYSCLWAWAAITKGRARSYDYFECVKLAFRRIAFRIYQIGFEQKLRKSGWRSCWCEWSRRPLIPEIVFGHRSLDWHGVASNPARYYFGITDHHRKNSGFDWSIINSKGPIVYCNISTAHGFQKVRESNPTSPSNRLDFSKKKFRLAKRFLNATLIAFSCRKDWQLILACGPFSQTLKDYPLSSNIHLYERVPQLSVLSRANLAITWGGAGTIRECINFGVPMLVFPAWTDQFGNAARISTRNLGIQGNILDVTPEKMIELVEKILADKTIRSSLEEMRRQSNVKNEIQELVHFVKCQTALEV